MDIKGHNKITKSQKVVIYFCHHKKLDSTFGSLDVTTKSHSIIQKKQNIYHRYRIMVILPSLNSSFYFSFSSSLVTKSIFMIEPKLMDYHATNTEAW